MPTKGNIDSIWKWVTGLTIPLVAALASIIWSTHLSIHKEEIRLREGRDESLQRQINQLREDIGKMKEIEIRFEVHLEQE